MTHEKDEAVEVLAFWWAAGMRKWYERDDAFDREIAERFGALHQRAASGECDGWTGTAAGALALIIVLDQFSRNLFRDNAGAFATDAKALKIAEAALAAGFDKAFCFPGRQFFYMPFMHAEDIGAQERCVDLFRLSGQDENYKYALIHMDVVRRFGRFPHRNAVLGRETSEAERAYLETGGFNP